MKDKTLYAIVNKETGELFNFSDAEEVAIYTTRDMAVKELREILNSAFYEIKGLEVKFK